MRRLFSTFAHGAPGAGLLLMRLAAGGALLLHGLAALAAGAAPAYIALHIACVAMGLLLVVGLWTPVVGALVAVAAALHGLVNPGDADFYLLVAALAAALALLGPGVWSVDARLYGWRRVEIGNGTSGSQGKKREPPPLE